MATGRVCAVGSLQHSRLWLKWNVAQELPGQIPALECVDPVVAEEGSRSPRAGVAVLQPSPAQVQCPGVTVTQTLLWPLL